MRIASTILAACIIASLALTFGWCQGGTSQVNLLLNPRFEFHAFTNHRDGRAGSYESGNVAFWNTDAWGDITVRRESHVAADILPDFSVGNAVAIAPGKRFYQFITLPEAGLAHGDRVSLTVFGHQAQPDQLRATVKLLKLDSQDGTWKPTDFGATDSREFPRHSRGELVTALTYEATAADPGRVQLTVKAAEIVGHFTPGEESHSDDVNTVAIQIELQNTAAAPAEGEEGPGEVWVCAPCLTLGDQAVANLPAGREMQPAYRYIPRTIQKLWKGEPIHVILMGSSIDRGSANPPMYPYDEDPTSETFKQPRSDQHPLDPTLVDRPDLDGYFSAWRYYYCYTGRLKRELMRKFNVGPDKILFNWMACDGSCVGEAHSGLADYASLSLPPDDFTNGHPAGRTWEELYPDLMARPGGPGPDLVIFGSGANEKTDTPDEVAVYEGTIRWFQSHYPGCEFLFGQFQNQGGYTPNPGDLQALAQRYQIPFMDYGYVGDYLTRWCNPRTLVPRDGHPQAASHYIWFKQLERAFECWDPTQPGQVQEQLPERAHRNTYGWEGDMVSFVEGDTRILGNRCIIEDTAFNAWGGINAEAEGNKEAAPQPVVDGEPRSGSRRSNTSRDVRNSWFRFGNLPLGDRHILEIKGPEARLAGVDCKVCPGRVWLGTGSPQWDLAGTDVTDFASQWGAPYGDRQAVLQPGQTFTIDVVATDMSVAYVDAPDGGTLRVTVDDAVKLQQTANVAFTDCDGGEHFMENRRGVLGLGFGLHRVVLEAVDAPVAVLGLFTYDARPNLSSERRLTGRAAAGDVVAFTLPFRARPVVVCFDGLQVRTEDITPTQVTFSGEGVGTYEVIGQ